jgi:hypothetical protein
MRYSAPMIPRSLLFLAAAFVTAVPAAAAPRPVPQVGSICPNGYSASAGVCVPHMATRCHAFSKVGATCPVGYTVSGGSYCLETACDSGACK